MELITTLLVLIQAAGAVVGAAGSVIGEVYYFRAMRDGRVSHAEREHLQAIGHALRFGMILLLVGSIGLVLVDFIYATPVQPAATASYWIEMALAIVVIIASWALVRRRAAFWLASSAAFTGWWMLALMVLGQIAFTSFGAAIAVYVVATGILAALLTYAREFSK